MITTNESIRKRIIALIPFAEHCSMFASLVKDVATEHRLTYERALAVTTEALIQGTSTHLSGGERQSVESTVTDSGPTEGEAHTPSQNLRLSPK